MENNMSEGFDKMFRENIHWVASIVVATAVVVSFYFLLSGKIDLQAEKLSKLEQTYDDQSKKISMLQGDVADIKLNVALIQQAIGIKGQWKITARVDSNAFSDAR